MKKRELIISLSITLIFLCLSFLSNLFLINTTNYKLDVLGQSLFDFYNNTYLVYSHPNILNVKVKEKNTYNDYYSYFRQDYVVGCIRSLIDDDTRIVISEQIVPVKFFEQPTYSISPNKNEENCYPVDSLYYYTYYRNELFDKNTYLTIRGDAEGFTYISDNLANRLIDIYGINNLDKPYETLIKDERFCFINVMLNDQNYIKLCINNIISSSSGKGPRAKDVYGNFGLIYIRGTSKKEISRSFEAELKTNSFNSSSFIEKLRSFGCNTKNTEYKFRLFDNNEQRYRQYDDPVCRDYNSKLYDALNSNNALFISLYVISFVFSIIVLLVLEFKIKTGIMILALFSFLLAFVIYNLVITFVYSYWLLSVLPLTLLIVQFIFQCKSLKKLTGAKWCLYERKKYEIEI